MKPGPAGFSSEVHWNVRMQNLSLRKDCLMHMKQQSKEMRMQQLIWSSSHFALTMFHIVTNWLPHSFTVLDTINTQDFRYKIIGFTGNIFWLFFQLRKSLLLKLSNIKLSTYFSNKDCQFKEFEKSAKILWPRQASLCVFMCVCH